jgi:hypothetical protein
MNEPLAINRGRLVKRLKRFYNALQNPNTEHWKIMFLKEDVWEYETLLNSMWKLK